MTYEEIVTFATQTAREQGVDPALVLAIIKAESGFKEDAISSCGARGLMQLMPATAKELGVDYLDPRENILGGVEYLYRMLVTFAHCLQPVELAIAAYNAGPGAVKKYNYTIPPYKETQDYVKKVLRYRDEFQQQIPPPASRPWIVFDAKNTEQKQRIITRDFQRCYNSNLSVMPLMVDGWAGPKTSAACKEMFGHYLEGDPRG